MRNNLITNFNCQKCGKLLEVERNCESKKVEDTDTVSGAFKIDMNIYVVPCANCLQPVEDIKRALSLLEGVVK